MSYLVFVDLDGVVADFLSPIRKMGLPVPDDYHFGNYTEEQRRLVKSLFSNSDFVASMPLIPGSAEAVYELSESGVFAGFLTSRPTEVRSATLWWVDQYFPDLPAEVFFTEDKGQFVLEVRSLVPKKRLVLVDDAPHQVESAVKAGACPVFLVDQPYNRTFSASRVVRVESLLSVPRALRLVEYELE